jgi:hypothetical protein
MTCFSNSIDTPKIISSEHHFPETDQLAAHIPIERAAIELMIARYPMRINPYFLSLVRPLRAPVYDRPAGLYPRNRWKNHAGEKLPGERFSYPLN